VLYSEGEDGVIIAHSKTDFWGVRPVFRFDPKSVIFMSEIMSEISADPKKGDTPALSGYSIGGENRSETIKNYKLTIVNSNSKDVYIANMAASGKKVEPDGGTVIEVPQSGEVLVSADGVIPWTRLTYKIVWQAPDGSRKIVGYGQRIPTSFSTVNSVLVDTAALSADTSYTVYVWSEKYEKVNSHEGSEPKYFTLNVLSRRSSSVGITSDSEGAGGCDAGFGIPICLAALLTALTLGFAVKRRR
jgi:hypothetical protein